MLTSKNIFFSFLIFALIVSSFQANLGENVLLIGPFLASFSLFSSAQ